MAKPAREGAGATPIYEVTEAQGGYTLMRNGRHLMTPAGKAYLLPTQKLADAIAMEWHAQGSGKPKPASMPLNQLACTALDILPAKRAEIAAQLSAYAESELLCHRDEAGSPLAEKQATVWQPLLDWTLERYDASLSTGSGIMPITQNPQSVAALRRAVEAQDDFHLAGLQQAVTVAGSLIIGLALLEGRIDALQAFEAAELEASHQIEKWGEDPASEARRKNVMADLTVCAVWFGVLSAK